MARRKPHDPAEQARKEAEKRERAEEIARLKSMGATVSLDSRTGKILSARRSNVFMLLLARKTITPDHYDAAYWLAGLWAAWKGLDGKPEQAGKVDGGSGAADLVTDRMIRAGKDVAWILGQVSNDDRILISAFMRATVEEDRAMEWRGIVQRHRGQVGREAETKAVVASLESLRAVYQEPRRSAA